MIFSCYVLQNNIEHDKIFRKFKLQKFKVTKNLLAHLTTGELSVQQKVKHLIF
jgi:hypothetical protein